MLAILDEAGFTTYIVGGSVRDALLSRDTGVPFDPKDIDVEVHGTQGIEHMQSVLRAAGCYVNDVGASFTVLTTRINGEWFDLALPRRDKKVGDGHSEFEVTFDPDIDEVDAAGRRELTISAIYWNAKTEELVDPWGGWQHLREGILSHPTDAFDEDILRPLRAAKFLTRGYGVLADDTRAICQELVAKAHHLPEERIWGEVELMLHKAEPAAVLDAFEQIGWSSYLGVHDRELTQAKLERAVTLSERNADERAFLTIAALSPIERKAMGAEMCEAATCQRVKNLERSDMIALAEAPLTPAATRHLARSLSKLNHPETVETFLAAKYVRDGSDSRSWAEVASDAGCLNGVEPPLVTGDALLDLGLTPGRDLGRIMKEAIRLQDEGELTAENFAAWRKAQAETALAASKIARG
jgi:tRNA nucleotidyltransferase (CCA-adding enzyme)